MFLSRYQDRPSTLKVEHEIVNNDRKGTVHSLNDFQITVWEDGEVTAQRKYYAKSDPQSTFPNMTVTEGQINLPIDDLVEFILAKITPYELAEGIILDDEARSALFDKMAERYNDPGFTDVDRREFLTKVQQQVYAIAVDRAVERLNKAEEGHRTRDDYYRWKKVEIGHYRGLYEFAARLVDRTDTFREEFAQCHTHPDKLLAWLDERRDPSVMESIGPQWHESRDYWRKRLEEFFPEPKYEAPEIDTRNMVV